MQRIVRCFGIALAFLSTVLFMSVPVSAQTFRTVAAYPANADMDLFPIASGPLSLSLMALAGLKPARLDSNRAFLNWNRKIGRFQFDTLKAGTIVLVDEKGTIRYKADCGNRLIDPSKCPECMGLAHTSFGPLDSVRFGAGAPPAAGLSAGSGPSAFSKALAAIGGFIATISKGLAWLLALLLGIALAALFLWALVELGRGIVDWFNGRPAAPAPAPASVAPLPVVTAAPVRAPEVNPIRPLGGARRPAQVGVRPVGAQGAEARAAAPVAVPMGAEGTAPAAEPVAEAPLQQGARRFVRFEPGAGDDPHTLHFSGMEHIHHEMHDDGSHTISYRHA